MSPPNRPSPSRAWRSDLCRDARQSCRRKRRRRIEWKNTVCVCIYVCHNTWQLCRRKRRRHIKGKTLYVYLCVSVATHVIVSTKASQAYWVEKHCLCVNVCMCGSVFLRKLCVKTELLGNKWTGSEREKSVCVCLCTYICVWGSNVMDIQVLYKDLTDNTLQMNIDSGY